MNMLSDKNIKNKWKHFDCEIGKEKKKISTSHSTIQLQNSTESYSAHI